MSTSSLGPLQGKSWRLNTPDVSSELIGNEVVTIHLPTGMYYSIENSAADLWVGIERGLIFDELVEILTRTYDVGLAQAAADASNFVTELLQENLVVEAPGSGEIAAPATGELKSYLSPRVDKFSDLQELLMIDPIHEVDERGWPHTKPE